MTSFFDLFLEQFKGVGKSRGSRVGVAGELSLA
jgi:hypothetical protein